MKRAIFTILFLLAGFWAFGQNSPVDRIFDKYSGKDGYTTVYISSFMFDLINKLDVDDPDYQEFKKATAGIKSIRILTQDSGDSQSFGQELLDQLPMNEYKEIMKVKDGDEDVLFLAREKGGKVSEFLLIVSGDSDDDVLIAITGDIDMETLSSLASGLDMPGMENLDEIDKLP